MIEKESVGGRQTEQEHGTERERGVRESVVA